MGQSGGSVEPLWKEDAFRIALDATIEHNPSHVFAMFSGGNDSAVLLHWAKHHLDRSLKAAVFIDTGTALPGVRDFAERFCDRYEIPLKVYEAGDAFERMVLGEGDRQGPRAAQGFPGPASHRYAYIRLKERQIERLVREHKQHPRDRIMLLTGVRRAESVRRMGTTEPVTRRGAQVWVAPLIDWTKADMLAYRHEHELPESDVAAMMHMSGECGCGAFATPGEKAMRCQLYPEWGAWLFDLEQRAEAQGVANCRWGERPQEDASEAGPMCSDCQGRLEFGEAAA